MKEHRRGEMYRIKEYRREVQNQRVKGRRGEKRREVQNQRV